MAHDADTSVAMQQRDNDKAAAARRAVPNIQPRGRCHNPLCELDVGPAQLFCDQACEREFERERKRGGV